jgi:4-amino-4-deoxy-L-arabinose transferase-like glycosyltransferase
VLTRRKEAILWLTLLLAAAFFRLAPIASSLPYIDYVDEGYVLHQTIHLLNQRSFDTKWYGYPSLPAYLTAAALTAWNPIYRYTRGHSFRRDLPREEEAQTSSGYNYDLISPPELIVAGRVVAAGLSIATVILAGAIAARLRGRAAGLIAMVITAVCPALVLRGSNVIVDTFAAFFAALAIYFCGRVRPNETWSAAAAGLAAGFAFSCKYTAGAVFAAVITVVCALPATKKFRVRLGLLAIGGLLLGIALGAPATIFNFRTALHDVAITAGNYQIIGSTPGYFGQAVGAFELGWLLALAGCVGLVLMFRGPSTRSTALGWSLFAILLLAPFVGKPFQPFRNLLPLVPPFCIAAAIAFSDVVDWARRAAQSRARLTLAIVLISAAVLSSGWSSFQPVQWRMAHRDSRIQAIDWLQQQATKEETVLGLRELAILPAEWKRLAATATVVSWCDAPDSLERGEFDYVVTGDFDLRHAPDPKTASNCLARWKEKMTPLTAAAEFGTGPSFVVPYVWRSNDERIRILRRSRAKSN